MHNPIHKDMIYAAKAVGLSFILNVALNTKKEIINAFAGDYLTAHEKGCEFISGLCRINPEKSDIVITSNGGYPLDQNIYQAVKGMTAAEASINDGGVIIMVAACVDGHGGKSFYNYFANNSSPQDILDKIEKVPQYDTVADQWQAQILARVLAKYKVIMVSDNSVKNCVNNMGMMYADSLAEAIDIATQIRGQNSNITIIPDGVSIIVN